MRWPFARRTADAEVEQMTGAPAPAWAALPPLQRTLTHRVPSTFKVGAEVTSDLVAVRSPRLTGPLGHLVSPLAPSGLVDGLVAPVQRHELTGGPTLELARPGRSLRDAAGKAHGALAWEAPDAGRPRWHLPALEPAEPEPRPVDAPRVIDDARPLPVVSRTAETAPTQAPPTGTDGEVEPAAASVELQADADVVPLERRGDAPEVPTLQSARASDDEPERTAPSQGTPTLALAPPIQPLAVQRRVVGTLATTSAPMPMATSPAAPAGVGEVAPAMEPSTLGGPLSAQLREELQSDADPLPFDDDPATDATVPTLAPMQPASVPATPIVPSDTPPVQRSRGDAAAPGALSSPSPDGSARTVDLDVLHAQSPGAGEPHVPVELAHEQPATHPFGIIDEPVEAAPGPLQSPAPVQRSTLPGDGIEPSVRQEGLGLQRQPDWGGSVSRSDPAQGDRRLDVTSLGVQPSDVPPATALLQRATLDLRSPPLIMDPTSLSMRTNVTATPSNRSGRGQATTGRAPITGASYAGAPALALAAARDRLAPVVEGTPAHEVRWGEVPGIAAGEGAVQRTPDGVPSPGAPPLPRSVEAPVSMQAVGIAAPPSVAGAAGAGAHGDLDELAKKLYDRIRWRLRTELRLDLERAGRSAGLQR